MDWRREMTERLGNDKNEKLKDTENRIAALKQKLLDAFETAVRALEDTNKMLVEAGKAPKLQNQGDKRSLTQGERSVEINLNSDRTRIDISLDGRKADSIVIFVNGDSIVLNSTKKAVDTDEYMGRFLMRMA